MHGPWKIKEVCCAACSSRSAALQPLGRTILFQLPTALSSYSSVVQALRCSHNCRQLAYNSFQLPSMSRDDHAVQLIGPKRRQNIITTLPQGWVSTRKHQYTTAITTMWTESSWAFPESYTANESWIVRSSDGGQRGDKRAHNSTIKVSFCTIIIRLCHCMMAITRVQSESL